MDSICGTKTYPNIDQRKINRMLQALRDNGATVSGNNPWNVDTHNHGVKLRASWNQSKSELTVGVTGKNFYVSCRRIWNTIDELIRELGAVADALLAAEGETARPVCGPWYYSNITQAKIDLMLEKLRESGAAVTGNNPWDVDTKKYGIKLRATWDSSTERLTVIVTAKGFFVPCSRIKSTIDKLIGELNAVAMPEAEAAGGVCPPSRLYPFSEERLKAVLAEARRQGAEVSGDNSYLVTYRGIEIKLTYQPMIQMVEVEIVRKPWFVPCARIWDVIESIFGHLASLKDEDFPS